MPKVYDCNQRAHNAFDVQMSREQLHRGRASWHIRSAPAPFGATRSIVSELVPLAAVPHNCQLPLPHQHPDRRAVECRCSLRIAARKQARKRTGARPVLPDASSTAAVVPTQKKGLSRRPGDSGRVVRECERRQPHARQVAGWSVKCSCSSSPRLCPSEDAARSRNRVSNAAPKPNERRRAVRVIDPKLV